MATGGQRAPLTAEQIAEAHKRHLRESAARSTLLDVCCYLLLLALIYGLVNLQMDPHEFSQAKSLRNIFLSESTKAGSLSAEKVVVYSIYVFNIFSNFFKQIGTPVMLY